MNLSQFIQDERGEVTILGIFFVLIILISLGSIMKKMISYHNELKVRLDTYNCFKQSIKLVEDAHSEMMTYNKALIAAHVAKATPIGPYAHFGIKGLKLLQHQLLIKYHFKIFKLDKCTLWNKALLATHFPFKTLGKMKLLRGPLDQALVKKKIKPIKTKAQRKQISYFTLKAIYKLSPTFQLIKTSEIKSPLMTIGAL